jgi:hypothetical protein
MRASVPTWQFCPSVDNTRAATLMSYPNFDSIASLLADAVVEDFAWEAFSGSILGGCHRASFLLRVTSTAYDAFFNSPAGYRGQFAASAAAGDVGNSRLLALFEVRLLAFAEGSSVIQSVIRKSLRGKQAKLWIFEPEVQAQLGATVPEIAYPVWEQASESGVGLLAPVGSLLEVKGGWIAQDGVECVNPSKSARSEEIHRTGFS